MNFPLTLSFIFATFFSYALAAYRPLVPGTVVPRDASDAYMRAAWVTDSIPLGDGIFDKYNTAIYAFLDLEEYLANETSSTPTPQFFNYDAKKETIAAFVKAARAPGNDIKKVLVSLRARKGFFSSSVTDDNRKPFISALQTLVTDHALDGIDFNFDDNEQDEFTPENQTCGASNATSSDLDNFLDVLKDENFKTAVPYVSASVGLKAFPDEAKVKAIAPLLGHISIMAYGNFGPRSNNSQVGPNAPLVDDKKVDSCNSFRAAAANAGIPDDEQSVQDAVASWTNAGIDPGKIVLGLAAFGRAYRGLNITITADTDLAGTLVDNYPTYGSFARPNIWASNEFHYLPPSDQCANRVTPEPHVPAQNGLISYRELVAEGYLGDDGNVPQNKGLRYAFDDCTQTSYVFNTTSGTLVSYDDDRSMKAKAHYIEGQKFKGFLLYQAATDHNHILVDAVITGLNEDE
ncbi:glycoside hydrolase [Hymenopellis radicata]|nr:glycoside hydrolase [Hymenopellis radicata]